jgi:hypothetical protein
MATAATSHVGAFNRLEVEVDVREELGWKLGIGTLKNTEIGVIKVTIPRQGEGGKDLVLSRNVGPGESYDKCAQVILNGMRKLLKDGSTDGNRSG